MGMGGRWPRLPRAGRGPGCCAEAATGRRPSRGAPEGRDPEDHAADRDHAARRFRAGSLRVGWNGLIGFELDGLGSRSHVDGWLMMPDLVRAGFRAMGTQVTCIGPAGNPAFDTAVRSVRLTFEREERRASRFRSDSELSRVNASAGSWVAVSKPFAALVAIALAAWERTNGRFDPTLLGALVDAGYDRDFDELLAGARAEFRPTRPAGRAGEVRLERCRLRLPEGAGLDLGGLAKGWTVDLAARAALEQGLPWVLINAGGDLLLAGVPPDGAVGVAVEDPEATDQDLGRIELRGGALATSSVTRRAWGPGLHHLIDPATGAPSAGPVVQATVWASTCTEAEISSKEALLEGEPFLDRAPGLLVLGDGRVVTNLETLEVAA